jgi:hypothetical protein
MNSKNRLQNLLRGWLPKEPTLLNRETPVNDSFKVFVHRMAVAVVVGALVAALLGVVGSLLGLKEGVGLFAWSLVTVIIISIGIGVYGDYMRRKLGLPAGTKPW